MSKQQVEDPTDQHQRIVQEHIARLDERIKQQYDEVKTLIKENEAPWRAVIFVATLIVVGGMMYMAYSDLAMRQQKMEDTMIKRVNQLRREVEGDIAKLKTQLGEALKTSLANHEIEILKGVKSSIKDLEKKIDSLK